MKLFADRARRMQPDFALDETTGPAVARMVARRSYRLLDESERRVFGRMSAFWPGPSGGRLRGRK